MTFNSKLGTYLDTGTTTKLRLLVFFPLISITASGICRPCLSPLALTCDLKGKDLTWYAGTAYQN